jgi:hypothetical protein
MGIVMWETLAQRTLFRRDTEFLTFQAITSEPVPDIRTVRGDLPAALCDAIGKALSRDRNDRFPTARAMADALGRTIQPASTTEIGDEVARAFETQLRDQRGLARLAHAGVQIDLANEARPGTDLETAMTTKLDGFRMLEGERPATADEQLALDPRDERGHRAQVRCAECAHENGAYADACEKCRATLLTSAVHRLNVRLHQDEQAAALAERTATPVVHVEPIAEREPVEQRTLLDRLAGQISFGSLQVRRALVVAAIAGVFGLLYLATGWHLLGFAFALIVTLGLCLVVT